MARVSSIVSADFLRKLGKKNLTAYLNKLRHPLREQIVSLLLEDGALNESPKANKSELSADCSRQIQILFHSKKNPCREKDLSNFEGIKAMTSPAGVNRMRLIAEKTNSFQYLRSEDLHEYDLATTLLLEHQEVFEEAYANLQVYNTQTWQLYYSKAKVEVTENLGNAQSTFEESLKELLEEDVVNLDSFTKDEKWWLFILRYPDKLSRVEDFNTKGEIQALSVCKPIKLMLIFYPQHSSLQIHLDKRNKQLSEKVCALLCCLLFEQAQNVQRQHEPILLGPGEI